MCTYVMLTWCKCIHICYDYNSYMHLCIIPISCTYMQRHIRYSHVHTIYISNYIHVNVVHMWVYTPMWGTHFHAYTYSVTLL